MGKDKKKTNTGSSPRTLLIEEAIEGITNAIVTYPSTPFTGNNADTLGRMLEALERSKRLDAEHLAQPDAEVVIVDCNGQIFEQDSLEDAARMYEWARDQGAGPKDSFTHALKKLRVIKTNA